MAFRYFDKLPPGLNEPGGRRLIADRELKVSAYLSEHGSWMPERGILKQIGAPPDEILTQHRQLVSIPSSCATLRRYLERNADQITAEQRVDIVHTLAHMESEFHIYGREID